MVNNFQLTSVTDGTRTKKSAHYEREKREKRMKVRVQ